MGLDASGWLEQVYAMTDSGVEQKAAECILQRFQKYKDLWFECIDRSFIQEEQKAVYKAIISKRLNPLLR